MFRMSGLGVHQIRLRYSEYQVWVLRISGLGTHRQFLVFKSPSHALHPVAKQIFLPKFHPKEVSSEEEGQELFPSLWSPAALPVQQRWEQCVVVSLLSAACSHTHSHPAVWSLLSSALQGCCVYRTASVLSVLPILHICLPTDGIEHAAPQSHTPAIHPQLKMVPLQL